MSEQSLSFVDLAIAGTLVLLNGAISLALGLGIARSLVIAGIRMVVQLLLVGLVLKTVFELGSPWLVGAVLLAMLASAAWETRSRQQRLFTGHWGYSLGAGTTALATCRSRPWPSRSCGRRPGSRRSSRCPCSGSCWAMR